MDEISSYLYVLKLEFSILETTETWFSKDIVFHYTDSRLKIHTDKTELVVVVVVVSHLFFLLKATFIIQFVKQFVLPEGVGSPRRSQALTQAQYYKCEWAHSYKIQLCLHM